jgi:hypothetical protein
MARPALQIGFHDHCFDGVASAATFLRFYRQVARPLPDEAVSLVGLVHQAGPAFGPDSFAGEENVVVDFRYSDDPRLSWWFDHHQSAFDTPALLAHFRADASGRKFWDPEAKSCARFLARTCRDRFGFDLAEVGELLDWAEIIDGALFPDARTAVELEQPALRLMMLLEATEDRGLCPRVVRELARRTLSAVLCEPWISEPLQPLLEKHRAAVRAVAGVLEVSGGVAFYDVAELGLDGVNKFIAYAEAPEVIYTVSVSRSPKRSKVSLGSNPWRQAERRHNLAELAQRYGGGGHPAVAAISFRPDELELARDVAKSLAAELRAGLAASESRAAGSSLVTQ